MRQLFDKDGKAIPAEDIAHIAFEAIRDIKNKNKDRLIKQVKDFANRRAKEGVEFSSEDAKMLIVTIENHDKHCPW